MPELSGYCLVADQKSPLVLIQRPGFDEVQQAGREAALYGIKPSPGLSQTLLQALERFRSGEHLPDRKRVWNLGLEAHRSSSVSNSAIVWRRRIRRA